MRLKNDEKKSSIQKYWKVGLYHVNWIKNAILAFKMPVKTRLHHENILCYSKVFVHVFLCLTLASCFDEFSEQWATSARPRWHSQTTLHRPSQWLLSACSDFRGLPSIWSQSWIRNSTYRRRPHFSTRKVSPLGSLSLEYWLWITHEPIWITFIEIYNVI